MGKCLLIRLTKPASLNIQETYPDTLPLASGLVKGGFNPCGQWDLLIDRGTDEWLGIVFYLSTEETLALRRANPEFDPRVIRFVDASLSKFLDEADCAETRGSHLQIVWTEREGMKIFPASEWYESWYADDVDPSKPLEIKDSMSPAHRFVALAVPLDAIIENFGGLCPRAFSIPVVDRLW